jgi:predicted nucleic acid-binding protein
LIVLLDTTVLIDALRGKVGCLVLLEELTVSGHTIATSAINIGEVYAGMRASEENKTDRFLDSLACYPLTREIAHRAGHLRNQWARKGRTLELADMMVAATALEYGAALMTENRKDFPVDGLRLYPEF